MCMNNLPFPVFVGMVLFVYWDTSVGGMLRGLAQFSLTLSGAQVSLMLVVPLSSSWNSLFLILENL